MRVALAEDSTLLREGLTRLLQEAGHTVTLARDGPELDLLVSSASHFDIAVLDIRLPPTFSDEGAQAAQRLRSVPAPPGVLLLSAHVDTATALRLLEDHPDGFGYLLKDRVVDVDELLDAIARVASGGFVIDSEVVRQLASGHAGHHKLARLTPREHHVLALVAQGHSNRAIARQVQVTPKTIENHVSSIFAKLDLVDQPTDHRRVKATLAYLAHAKPDAT